MKNHYHTNDPGLEQKSTASLGRMTLLSTFAFLLSIGNSTFAQEKKSNIAPWDSKNLKEEIVNKRSRTTKHFLVENGSKVYAFMSPSSIHYMEAGKWEDINTDILSNTKSNYVTHPYTSERNSIKTDFPSNPFNNYILMNSKEGSFKEKVSAIRFVNANNVVLGTLPVSGNVTSVINGNKITYSGFYPNVSLDYVMGSDQRKFNLVIHSSAFLNSIPAGATSIVIEEEFVSDNKSVIMESNKAEVVVTINNKQVLSFSQPVGFDANTTNEDFLSGSMSIQKNQNTFSLKTSFPLAWLQNSNRVFPVLLDPTVNYYPQNVSMWTGYTSSATKTSGIIRMLDATITAWAKFDLTTLPAGASVTQVTYYGNFYTSTLGNPPKITSVRGAGAVDPVSATAAAIFPLGTTGTMYEPAYSFGVSAYGWLPVTLNNTANNDVAAAAGGMFSLIFGFVSGNTAFMYHYGYNAAAASRSYLEVVYFTTPCVGAPGANAVTPSSFTTCPSYTNPAVSLANTYTVGGLNYQWYSSTVSPVGLYLPIQGATLNVAPIPTLGVTTWFQVVATCTNPGGLSTTLTPSQFTVAGTTINNIPYYEGFEGLQVDDRLPNCSWSTTNLGTTIGTYTSSRSDNRVPYEGNKFAAFGISATNHHVYTNGLNLISGITYSASIMYATEYTGGTNWSELSLLVGPNQTPAGLVNIASANPVTSGAYKQLSGVFTVPSTGIYYIAIKANGSAGTALYVSWDNLEVTIPCEGLGAVNAPTVMVTAASTVVCTGEMINLSAAGADTYTWSNGANTSGITETAAIAGLTNYTVEGSNALTGCIHKFIQPLNVMPSPIVLASAYPATVCPGQPVTLNATGNAVNYLWSNGSPVAVISVTTGAAASYTAIGTGSNGCMSSAGVAVAVYSLPVVFASSSIAGEACKGDAINLSASGAASYEWISDTAPNVYQGSTITLDLSGTTIFTVSGTSLDGCTAKYQLTQSVSECVGIKEQANAVSGLMIYPNPTNGVFTVELKNAALKTIEVVDLTGRVISTATNSDEKTDINMSALANGVYYVKVKTENGVSVNKIVKN